MPAGKRKSSNGVASIIGGIAFIAFGIVFFTLFAGKFFTDTSEWQAVDGVVESVSVKTRHSHTKHGGRRTTYSPDVEYSYSVGGKQFKNNDISKMPVFSSFYEDAKRQADVYSHGQKIQVFYNPENPRESLLNTEIPLTSYLFALFPLISVFVGCFGIKKGWQILALKHLAASGDIRSFSSFQLKRTSGAFGGILIFTILWCLVSAFFVGTFFSFHKTASWTFESFLSPFSLMLLFPLFGIFLIILTVKKLIARIGVGHYSLEISCDNLAPGSQVRVVYTFDGDPEKLTNVRFFVRNSFVRSRGVHNVEEQEVYNVDSQLRCQQGTFTFVLPDFNPDGTWNLVARYGKLEDYFSLPVV